jgi:hypothetical protein
MAEDKHLDKDIVNLFIDSGLVYEYAQKYLHEDQIDIALELAEEKK